MTRFTLREFIIFIALLATISILLFWGLGSNSLTDWDEAWYAGISRTMARNLNFFTPEWNGEPFFEKTPLYFWLSAFAYRIFGEGEFSARFISALSGIGIMCILFLFAKKYFSMPVAITSILILFSSPFFVYRSRTGNLDTLLTLWTLLAFFSFVKAVHENQKWYFILAFSISLAFLTKGFVGFYPMIAVLIYMFLTGKVKDISLKWLVLSVLISILPILVWGGISYITHGNHFLFQFFAQNTEKFGFSFNTLQNFSFEYLGYIKSGTKLWSLLIIGGAMIGIVNKNRLVNLLSFYCFLFIFIMSFSENKGNWYILPLYPVFALLASYFVFWIWTMFVKRLQFSAVVVILFLAIVQMYIYRSEFFVPDVSADEARVAREIKKNTSLHDVVYLTNYYYPTTVYYSERKVLALYSEHQVNSAWWIRPKSSWSSVFSGSGVCIATTENELAELQSMYPNYKFETIYSSGSKMFVKKI